MITPKYKPNRFTMTQHLIEYMIGLAGYKMVDTLSNDKWHSEWKLTSEQYQEFVKYSIPLIKKVFRCNRKKAQTTFDWFYGVFGLKIIKNYEKSRLGT